MSEGAVVHNGPVSRAAYEKRVAELEHDIEIKQEVWNHLDNLADEARRDLTIEQGRLQALKDVVAQRGLSEP